MQNQLCHCAKGTVCVQDNLTPVERFRKSKSKKGNAAEFMQLLSSLTKRW
jgi:hypothetical protein